MSKLYDLPEGFFFRTYKGDNCVWFELRKKTWGGFLSEQIARVMTKDLVTEELIQRAQQQLLKKLYEEKKFELTPKNFYGDSTKVIK